MGPLRTLRHITRVCFGTEVRFFILMTYLIIVMTLAFGL